MRAVQSYLRERFSLGVLAYLLLIYIILYAVLLGVELVARGTSAEVLQFLILLGIITGWLLGRSSLKNWLALLISAAAGIAITLIRIGGIDVVLGDIVSSGIRFLWRTVTSWSLPDSADLNFLFSSVQSRFLDVFANLLLWIKNLLAGVYLYNQISALFLWGFLIWAMAVWFSWVTRKKNLPLWGLIPAVTLLAVLMTYTLEKRILLVIVLGAGLILVGLINHDQRHQSWKKAGIKGADNVKEQVVLVIIGLSVYVMIFAGLMPSVRIRAISDPFERLVYGDRTAGESGADGTVEIGTYNPDLYTVERFAGMPRQKLIGSGPELAKRVVMIVSYPGTAFVSSELPAAARYWRSYTYDQYTGSGWQSGATVEVEYKPGQEIIQVQTGPFEIITQEIRLSNAIRGTLYSAGPPITLDQGVLASWRTDPRETTNGDSPLLLAEDLFAVTLDKLLYQVRSLISTASDQDLRQAEGDIPEWIGSKYLALPETVPDRVIDLAREIVINQPTSYDQAKAIETFLRSYPYTLELPAPPLDRDVADYFLFDLQAGYCDYYATSMVVLARAVGLPARVVVGFVGGQFDPENNLYLVSEADAHTWAEVYFPGYGWIPFEPTAARDLIDDQALSLPLPPELEQPPRAEDAGGEGEFPGREIGIGILAGLVFVIWLKLRADWARLKRLDANSLALAVYQELYRYGRWLDLGHARSSTLYEFENRIKHTLGKLANTPRRQDRLQPGMYEISLLTNFAVLANYSSERVDPEQKKEILQTWKNLRIRLREAVWLTSWKRFRERVPRLRPLPDSDHSEGNGAADE